MKKKKQSGNVVNKRAHYDYDIESSYIAGISLTGPEVKSLRSGHGILRGTYVQIKENGAWLINLQVTPMVVNRAHLKEEDQTRTRQLLLKAKELDELRKAKNEGRQIVPLKLLTKTRFIKIEIGVGKSKKIYDKRQAIKKRDTERIELRSLKY